MGLPTPRQPPSPQGPAHQPQPTCAPSPHRASLSGVRPFLLCFRWHMLIYKAGKAERASVRPPREPRGLHSGERESGPRWREPGRAGPSGDLLSGEAAGRPCPWCCFCANSERPRAAGRLGNHTWRGSKGHHPARGPSAAHPARWPQGPCGRLAPCADVRRGSSGPGQLLVSRGPGASAVMAGLSKQQNQRWPKPQAAQWLPANRLHLSRAHSARPPAGLPGAALPREAGPWGGKGPEPGSEP